MVVKILWWSIRYTKFNTSRVSMSADEDLIRLHLEE